MIKYMDSTMIPYSLYAFVIPFCVPHKQARAVTRDESTLAPAPVSQWCSCSDRWLV